MDCIVWCAQEIQNLLNLIDLDERWYEKDAPSESAVRITDRGIFTGVDLPNGAGSLVFDIDKVKSLNSKDLQVESQMNDTAVRQPSDFLHHGFKQAANNAIATRAITKNRNDISRPPARLRQTLTFVFRHFHRISFQRGQYSIVILKLLD